MKGRDFKNNESSIDLKDGEHSIAIDFNTFELLEGIYGDMETVFSKFEGNSMKFADIKNFLTAGLNSCIENKNEHFSSYEVGKLLDITKMNSYATTLMQLINNAMPEAEVSDDEKN